MSIGARAAFQRRAPAFPPPRRPGLLGACLNQSHRLFNRRRGLLFRVDPIHYRRVILLEAHCDGPTSPDKGALGRFSLENNAFTYVLMGAAPDRRSRWSRAPPPFCIGTSAQRIVGPQVGLYRCSRRGVSLPAGPLSGETSPRYIVVDLSTSKTALRISGWGHPIR